MVELRHYNLGSKDAEQETIRVIDKFSNDERLSKKNRELGTGWLNKHKQHLQEKYDNTEKRKANAHKTYSTINHRCMLLRNLSLWLDFSKIDEKTLIQFKQDFFELEGKKKDLRSIKGKKIKSQREYINKLICSDFFRNYLGLNDLVNKVFNNKIIEDKPSVEFITIDDLKLMVKKAPYLYQKVILYLLFSTGARIGSVLNLKKKDFEIQYNQKTKVSYYLCHLRKEYLKGSNPDDVTLPIVIPECNDLLQEHLKELKPDEFIIPVSYGAIRVLLDKVTTEAKIKTKPDGKKPTIHILRKSAALHLLNQGYSLDQVKCFLAHKPSSSAIDCYVTYKGLKFEPEVTKVQTDELLKLKDTLKNNETQMLQMQQQMDKMNQQMAEFIAKNSSKEEIKSAIIKKT